MFGLFGRKKRERQFMELLQAAEEGRQEEQFRIDIEKIVRKFDLDVSSDDPPEKIASAVAGLITKLVVRQAGWNTHGLSREQEFVALVAMFIACDYLSRKCSASFEMCTVAAPVYAFGATWAKQVAGSLGDAGTEYNRLMTDPETANVGRAIGQAFANWVGNRSDDELQSAAELMNAIVEAIS